MKKPRQFKPIHELDRLSEAERDQLWTDMNNGLSYDRALLILAKEHFAIIKRHRLYTWWHREDMRRQLNANLPAASRLAAVEFLQLLNGQTLPWSDLMQARILRAAFLLTEEEEQTPSKLLALQRIANNEFHQEMAREKLDLEKRRMALREKQAMKTTSSPAQTAPATGDSPTQAGNGDEEKEEPFRLWTPEELAVKQPIVLEVMRRSPLLRQMLEPDEEPAPVSKANVPTTDGGSEHGQEPANP